MYHFNEPPQGPFGNRWDLTNPIKSVNEHDTCPREPNEGLRQRV